MSRGKRRFEGYLTRGTSAQEAVEDVLRVKNPSPLTLKEIFTSAQKRHPSIAYSTVYRIIRRLEEKRHIVRIDWRERGSRYEWHRQPHHHHIVCSLCGKVHDFSDDDSGFDQKRLETLSGYVIQRHSIELEGVCPQCLAKTP